VLGEVFAATGNRRDADAAFRLSRETLEEIQAYPELAQTLLAYGRFRAREDRAAGRELIEHALRLFEEMGATGWMEETRAAACR
jgi:hypothetical protein